MNTSLHSHDSTNKLSCFCGPDGTAETKQTPGSTRRGFLSSLVATGTATGQGATLAGCQSIEGIFGTAPPAKSPRIDIHHHMVPPSYAADMKRMGIGSPR